MVTKSKTDPDSGLFVNGEHKSVFDFAVYSGVIAASLRKIDICLLPDLLFL